MPCEVFWEEEGVWRRFSGLVTGDDILRSNLQVHTSNQFRKLKYQIVDFSGTTEFNVAEEDMRTISEYDAALAGVAPRLKVAVITVREEIIGYRALYKEGAPDSCWELAYFEDLQSARNWVSGPAPA